MIYEENYTTNTQLKYAMYRNISNDIKAFVSIGGNMASRASKGYEDEIGVISDTSIVIEERSPLMDYFLKNGSKAIRILNTKSLATKYGMAYDPSPLPKIGTEDLYFEVHRNNLYIYIEIIIFILIMINVQAYFRSPKN